MGKQIAILPVSYAALEQALHMPEGHRIVGIRLVDTFTDTFEIAVEGPSFSEVGEFQVIPRTTFSVTVTENREDLVPSRKYTGKFG